MTTVSSLRLLFVQVDRSVCLGHLDQWFDLPGRLGLRSHGEIHLILEYQRLTI